ncbi:hypothetical protein Tco_0832052 [Tanacetum coccineum]
MTIWEAFGGNTRGLDSIWEETGQECNCDDITSFHDGVKVADIEEALTSVVEVPSGSALQVLRGLGSIFTSVYAAKLKRVVSLLEGLQSGKKIALCKKE